MPPIQRDPNPRFDATPLAHAVDAALQPARARYQMSQHVIAGASSEDHEGDWLPRRSARALEVLRQLSTVLPAGETSVVRVGVHDGVTGRLAWVTGLDPERLTLEVALDERPDVPAGYLTVAAVGDAEGSTDQVRLGRAGWWNDYPAREVHSRLAVVALLDAYLEGGLAAMATAAGPRGLSLRPDGAAAENAIVVRDAPRGHLA